MVEGYKTFATLPFEEEWSIIHNKTIDRQENQNERYYKIETRRIKMRKYLPTLSELVDQIVNCST
jgi:hypothetical protein